MPAALRIAAMMGPGSNFCESSGLERDATDRARSANNAGKVHLADSARLLDF